MVRLQRLAGSQSCETKNLQAFATIFVVGELMDGRMDNHSRGGHSGLRLGRGKGQSLSFLPPHEADSKGKG